MPGSAGKNLYFNDVSTHWAQPFINTLQNKGVIQVNSQKAYYPNRPITRAEAVMMVARAKNWLYSRESTLTFKDVPPTHWAYRAVSQLKYHQIISDNKENLFRPNTNLTRAESAVMIYNTLRK